MSENRQKGKSGGKSKYAIKKSLQNSGTFSKTSPFAGKHGEKTDEKPAGLTSV